MTDKEKIELIIQDKHLNSTQFCNEVCIAPGTLSHIRSGRTEPTLNILRNISQAFPDINPAWLFYGEEPMYKKANSPTPESEVSNATIDNNVVGDVQANDSQLSFAFPAASSVPARSKSSQTSPLPSSSSGVSGAHRPSPIAAQVPVANVQDVVAETMKQYHKPQRKVVEVRIFFDDGTFETFSAN
ncbi:MAG: helix-turn-helix domain-containing protein [Bacteroidaceae bacterium]|nr:helix-turn-helix domain-containing protein [Bacteroidaceae bacterium]